jgi:hypothetical protein
MGLACAVGSAQPPPALEKSSNPLLYTAPPDGWSSSPFHTAESQGQSARLAKQYVKTEKEEERKTIRKKLAEVLEQQFDARAKQQQKELEELEKQIASLRALLKKRMDAKSTIIDRRIEQLIQEAEGLGWNAPSSPHAPTTYRIPSTDVAPLLEKK